MDIVGFFGTIFNETNLTIDRTEQLIINSGSCETSLKKNGAGKTVTADNIRYIKKAKRYTILHRFI